METLYLRLSWFIEVLVDLLFEPDCHSALIDHVLHLNGVVNFGRSTRS